MRWYPRWKRKFGWHRWFAWYPVCFQSGMMVWWEWIERQRKCEYYDSFWEYRGT